MNNTIKRILMYFIGYFIIFESIAFTGIELKWWQVTMIIIGVCIIDLGDIIYPYKEKD